MKFYIRFNDGTEQMVNCEKMVSNNLGMSFHTKEEMERGENEKVFGLFVPYANVKLMKHVR